MSSTILVLDANILIRATLGNKVKTLLIENSENIDFFTPKSCIIEAEKYLPLLFEKRNMPSELALKVFTHLKCLVQIIDKSIYEEYATQAKHRLKNRDLEDWPVAASALLLDCPIWTEDQDFFGTGIPTWTTDRIHVFFDSHRHQK